MSKVLHHGYLYSKPQYNEVKNFLLGPNAKWTYTGGSLENSKRFWFHHLFDEPFFVDESVFLIRQKTGITGNLIRVYANGQTIGQDGDWHVDDVNHEGGTTVLWYLDDFEFDWAGKTLFKHNGGLIEYVVPAKNKFISFPSKLLHKGEAPNQNFNDLRITVAWKFSD